MAFSAVDGVRIYYRLEGNKGRPLLVLAHSLGVDHGMWDPQMPALLTHFQILRLDLRGHGASDAPPSEYSIAMLAHDVLAVTGGSRFAFCGLSLGGMIGQWLGANAPGQLTKLVIANTSPKTADPTVFDKRRQAVLTGGMLTIADSVMQRFFSPDTLSRGLPEVATVLETLLSTDPNGYAGCCSAVRDMDNRPLLANIRMPVLLIAGDHDFSTPWEGHGDRLAASIPGARVLKLPTAHLSNIEQPAAFNKALIDFLG